VKESNEQYAARQLKDVLLKLALSPEDTDALMAAIDDLIDCKIDVAMDGVVRGGMPYYGA
jgi:hypothetical protein